MKASNRIFLYGNSVMLGIIGTSLNQFSDYEVVALKLPQEKSQRVGPAMADILIFDLQITRLEEVMSFFQRIPTLLLIGVDPDVNQVQFWSGRQVLNLSTQGLLELIRNEVNQLSAGIDCQ